MTPERRAVAADGFLHNPIIRRYRISLLRPRQAWIYGVVYGVVFGLMMLLNYAHGPGEEADLTQLHRRVYAQLMFLEVALLWLWGGYNAGSVLHRELLQKSYDFFKMLPLTAQQKALGLLVGVNLIPLLLAAFTAVFLLVSGPLAGLPLGAQCENLFGLISFSYLIQTTALLSSIRTKVKERQVGWPVVLIVSVLFLFPLLTGLLPLLSHNSATGLDRHSLSFYGVNLPVISLISSIALYFGVWAHLGLLRKLRHERQPLFSPRGALVFVAGWLCILTGLFRRALTVALPDLHASLLQYWLIGLGATAFVTAGVLTSHHAYLEQRRRTQPGQLWLRGNLARGLVLFALWAAWALLATLGAEQIRYVTLQAIGGLFSFVLFYVLLLEVYVLLRSTYPKIKLLVAFVFFLDLVLPPLCALVFSAPVLADFSPFGFIVHLLTLETMGTAHAPSLPTVMVVNLILSLLPLWQVHRKYREIESLRQTL